MPTPTIQLHVGDDVISTETYDSLLHFDDDRAAPVVQAMYDAMLSKARELNPEVSAEAKVCGGCVMMALGLLLDKIMTEGGADHSERFSYRTNFINRLRRHQLVDDFDSSLAALAGDSRH